MSLLVKQPGLLSLLHDRGRFGQAKLGLTAGGPADPLAANLANRLLANDANATLLEVSFGGLLLLAQQDAQIAITGAKLPITIDGQAKDQWRVLTLRRGETLELGFSELGCRSYLAVRGGFSVKPTFGSTSTVVREGIGGLNGGKLGAGDVLDFPKLEPVDFCWLPPQQRPTYHKQAILRVVLGYQVDDFSSLDQQRFFSSEYQVSDRCDRMGYRLDGPPIPCSRTGMLSEGITLGAIQVPADGQPIVLLHDRQTIGGYPKLGAVLSIDCSSLAQLRPGNSVHFLAVTPEDAHNAVNLAHVFERSRRIEAVPR
ncbi:MAG: biotin-dependent carboxyltransferase family protein [Pseudomonadota bacterium]